MAPKNFNEYKRHLSRSNAYKVATEIQEGFALALHGGMEDEKQYEGHISVMDVLGKIDAMVKMFERTMSKNPTDKSAQKIVEVVEALYDLASSKLHEAKKQCSSYMKKASGVSAGPSRPRPVPFGGGMGPGMDSGMGEPPMGAPDPMGGPDDIPGDIGPDSGPEGDMGDDAGAPPPPTAPKPMPKFSFSQPNTPPPPGLDQGSGPEGA